MQDFTHLKKKKKKGMVPHHPTPCPSMISFKHLETHENTGSVQFSSSCIHLTPSRYCCLWLHQIPPARLSSGLHDGDPCSPYLTSIGVVKHHFLLETLSTLDFQDITHPQMLPFSHID